MAAALRRLLHSAAYAVTAISPLIELSQQHVGGVCRLLCSDVHQQVVNFDQDLGVC